MEHSRASGTQQALLQRVLNRYVATVNAEQRIAPFSATMSVLPSVTLGILMAIMTGLVGGMSAFYHDSTDITNPQHREISAIRLIAKMPTLVAMAYKYGIGQPYIYPKNSLSYSANFMRMMFATPCEEYVPDDVLVFVTGVGSSAVAASFSGGATDKATSLRAQPMELTFTAADRYTITDIKTGTVLAERSFDPTQLNASIEYQGLKVSFSTAPKTGDRFLMDGNKDGTGNNENMLRLAGLESTGLVAGKTIGASYIDHVNDMGNISRQSTIAKEALTVVHDQAVAARDKVSGVSLDEEAANLIRFQQAYQASAKVMQVATVLFDAVLAVR